MKRMIAMLLCLSMVFGLLPAVATAQEQTPVQTVVTAEELPGVSRVDDLQLPQKQSHRLHGDDEIVTVIVELEEKPLLADFEAKSGSSVGSQVSAYLTAAATEAAALKNRQDNLVQVMGKAVGMELNVTGRYVNAVNAVTVRVPYGKIDSLRAVEGVRSVNVERVFSRPVTTSGELIEGDFGHSYNMTDLGEVWAAGYTGQGMLVAVLDTGLDLTYTSWGSFETGVRRVHEAFTDNSFRSDLTDADLRYTSDSLARFLQTTQLISTTGMDGQKNTFVRLYGLEKCEELVKEHTEAAIDALDVFEDSEFMRELALSLVGREM